MSDFLGIRKMCKKCGDVVILKDINTRPSCSCYKQKIKKDFKIKVCDSKIKYEENCDKLCCKSNNCGKNCDKLLCCNNNIINQGDGTLENPIRLQATDNFCPVNNCPQVCGPVIDCYQVPIGSTSVTLQLQNQINNLLSRVEQLESR